jgi:class 3 adenylate cyclase/putative methionine-R-sulfoxide reductase with GAF domain
VSTTVDRDLERLRMQQRAIVDVLRVVARADGLMPVFDAVVDAATRISNAEYGGLYLAEGELFRLEAGAHGGSSDIEAQFEYEREHPITRDGTTLVGRVALSGELVHIPDVLADSEYSWEAQRLGGYRSVVGLPIVSDDQLRGVLCLARMVPEPFSEEQIELLRGFADQAAIAIANARLLDTVERQKREILRFVSPQVAELLTSEEGERMLAGHRAYISVVFTDLRGFTNFAQTAAPEELLEVLGSYHNTIGELIHEHNGTLEHFAGDGVMVFFNDPAPVENHELEAARFALAAHDRFEPLATLWTKRGIQLGLGIGISAGYATLGRIGFEGRYEYGALGPDTSLASRLSTHAEPGQTLISQRVHAAIEQHVEVDTVGALELKGFAQPVTAYELRSLRS